MRKKYFFRNLIFLPFLDKQLATPFETSFSTVPPPENAKILTHWKRFQQDPFGSNIFATSFPATSGSRLFARFLTSLTSTSEQSRVKSAECSPNFSLISPAEAFENDDKNKGTRKLSRSACSFGSRESAAKRIWLKWRRNSSSESIRFSSDSAIFAIVVSSFTRFLCFMTKKLYKFSNLKFKKWPVRKIKRFFQKSSYLKSDFLSIFNKKKLIHSFCALTFFYCSIL